MKKQDRRPSPFKIIARHLQGVKIFNDDAGGHEDVSKAIDRLCRFLAKTPAIEIEKIISHTSTKERQFDEFFKVASMSRDELEKLVKSVETPRRVLEEIAIRRFGVPSGSMRSFPKISILQEKILTLIENERAHDVIGAAAKRSAE